MEKTDRVVDDDRTAVIFLGTGCSATVPSLRCLIQPSDPPCTVCSQSLTVPPHSNPNYRCNTSLLIDYCPSNGEHNYILIDAGKTFREQVLRWFTFHKIPRVDSIILTHEHADAVHGLDDIRSVQPKRPFNDSTPVYLTQFSMDSVASRFPYLVKTKLKEGEVSRRVSLLDWRIIEPNRHKPFIVSGLSITPLPVMHGEDYLSLGFLFGVKNRVAYVSDVSRFLPSTEQAISGSGDGPVDLLILDTNSLAERKSPGTHIHFPEALEIVKRFFPKKALLIGMTHEYDHHTVNAFLQEWSQREGIYVQLAHDGLRVPIDL